MKEQTINYRAQTLAWLTTEVEQLRQQITQLQMERENVVANAQLAPALEAELAQLRAENVQLRQAQAKNVQLRQAQAKLEAFRQLLTNGNGQEAVTGPAQTTTVAPTAVVTTPSRFSPVDRDLGFATNSSAKTGFPLLGFSPVDRDLGFATDA